MKLELKHYLDAFKYKVPCRLSEIGIFNLDLEYPDNRYNCIGYITDLSTYNNGSEINGVLTLQNGLTVDFDFKLGEESELKLIYHSLSDLTKEIEHNLKKVIPIIELFEIVDGGSCTKDKVFIEENELFCKISNCTSELIYYHDKKFFNYISLDYHLEDTYPIFNQLELFEKLHEWHFDIYGLIENGLAIDINTL